MRNRRSASSASLGALYDAKNELCERAEMDFVRGGADKIRAISKEAGRIPGKGEDRAIKCDCEFEVHDETRKERSEGRLVGV